MIIKTVKTSFASIVLLAIALLPINGCGSQNENIGSASIMPNESGSFFSFDNKTSESPFNNSVGFSSQIFSESYLFFTDPHPFLPNTSLLSSYGWFESNISLLSSFCQTNHPDFVLCGGDLLTHGDSKPEACEKLRFFVDYFHSSFNDFYILTGNHDTNYQGDTYDASNDYQSCMLSQELINQSLFYGRKSYYSFETTFSNNYCFDSGIDWGGDKMDDYKWEQVRWFANDLLTNSKDHIIIFVHIALYGANNELTALMKEIERIIIAFNTKSSLTIGDEIYSYCDCSGHIDFVQAGHQHEDLNTYKCGGVPIIITANYSYNSPSFDYVGVDFINKTAHCFRYGAGLDRLFAI